MFRAIELASQGLGWASPNPLVGCIITRDDKIIGEGWHRKYGEAHAEVNAINQVENPAWFRDCELFVTLEPCSHFGKTPPCADLIISKKISKVYIADLDPNPIVNGAGIKKLRDAGIQVTTGMLTETYRKCNKRYFKAISTGKPYIILKWAQTLDGYLARRNFDSKWISNEYSRQLVHKWRSEEDAVLVGFNTVKYDNPQLNVRNWKGKEPVRVIIDKELALPAGLHYADHSLPTLVFNTQKEASEENLKFIKSESGNFINVMLQKLTISGIHSLMVEGGAGTINEFIQSDNWDEARIFICDKIFQDGIAAPILRNHKLVDKESITGDTLVVYENQKS